MSDQRPHVRVYTDGACDPNPGPGGWAYILIHVSTGTEKEGFGSDPDTTNNRMELTAAIEALKTLKTSCVVELFTDSEYLHKGLTVWMPQWIANHWRRSNKAPVLNSDLWKALHALTQEHEVTPHWVEAHAGDPYNERVDRLARAAILR